MATSTGRDQVATVRLGAKRDGTLTALHADILADMGAYLMLLDADDPVARRVRHGRRLRHPGDHDGHHGRLHEQVRDGRDPRRRQARGDAT
jgi:hypothetical protein